MTQSKLDAARSLRAAFERDRKRTQTPATKREMDALKAQRARPNASLQYTPGGTLEASVHTRIEAARETRIGFIQKRLQRQSALNRDHFNRSR